MGFDLLALLSLDRNARCFYRMSFLAAAAKAGLLKQLYLSKQTFGQLCASMQINYEGQGPFAAWLELGVSVNEIAKNSEQKYFLKGRLARFLADSQNDSWLAITEEISTLHYTLMMETPELSKKGNFFSLKNQDPEVIARSSRGLEFFITRFLKKQVPKNGILRMLEIGCGSGVYIRECCKLNPELTAIGLELQAPAKEMASQNIRAWNLERRAQIEIGDFRTAEFSEEFDLITMHNNIYYFKRNEYQRIFTKIFNLLKKKNGTFIVTTGCQGGTPAMQALNLWACATENCSPLPQPNELMISLRDAGFSDVKINRLAPIESLYGFVAKNS